MGNSDSKDREITHGLRIIKIFEDSPAKQTDLCIYTDFIVDIGNKPEGFKLDRDFYKFVIMNENQTIRIFVYNILTQQTRFIDLFLTRDWPNSDFLLGFKVRIENLKNAQKNIYRILNVFNPAMQKIVIAKKFFFIAIEEFSFNDLDDLKQKLRLYQKCNIVFFDINTVNVIIVPFMYNPRTGLGFELGTGYLHDLQFIIQSLIKNREKMNSLSYRDNQQDQSIEIQQLKEQYKKSFQNREQQKLSMNQQNQEHQQGNYQNDKQTIQQVQQPVQQKLNQQQDKQILNQEEVQEQSISKQEQKNEQKNQQEKIIEQEINQQEVQEKKSDKLVEEDKQTEIVKPVNIQNEQKQDQQTKQDQEKQQDKQQDQETKQDQDKQQDQETKQEIEEQDLQNDNEKEQININ